MSDFMAKMHQIRFRPKTTLGELTALPRPLAGFKGPTSKGREGNGKEGKGGRGTPRFLPGLTPLVTVYTW